MIAKPVARFVVIDITMNVIVESPRASGFAHEMADFIGRPFPKAPDTALAAMPLP
jgi:hypothetical protein